MLFRTATILVLACIWASGILAMDSEIPVSGSEVDLSDVKVHIQGRLLDVDGHLAEGYHNLLFNLYEREYDEEPFWSDEVTEELVQGVYSILLGEVEQMGVELDRTYWVGICMDSEEELARLPIVFTRPFEGDDNEFIGIRESVWTNTAMLEDWVRHWTSRKTYPGGFAWIEMLEDGIAVKGQSYEGTGLWGESNSADPIGIGVYARNTAGGLALKAEGISYFSGNVGIGTEDPLCALDVAGKARFYCPSDSTRYIRLNHNDITLGYRNRNFLQLYAYDESWGNFITTEDPEVGYGQGFGIVGGPHVAPFERFVVNTDDMYLGYCIKAGNGSGDTGGDGAGNLYVHGNVGVGTKDPAKQVEVHTYPGGGDATIRLHDEESMNFTTIVDLVAHASDVIPHLDFLIKINDVTKFGIDTYGNIYKTGSCSFVEDHPRDPEKEIVYVCLEGGETGTYMRGEAQLVYGEAEIELPHHFRLVTSETGLTCQLTPLDDCNGLRVDALSNSSLRVKELNGGTSDAKFYYLVNGIRKGYENYNPIKEKMVSR
jgi:hypothetical protein